MNLVERGAVPRLGVVSLIADPLAQGHPRLLGHAAQRLRESEVLDQHHKVEYVAARLAAKTVEDLFPRMDREGRSFLLVKRAEAQVMDSGLAELHVIAHNLDDIRRRPNFVHFSHGVQYFSFQFSVISQNHFMVFY